MLHDIVSKVVVNFPIPEFPPGCNSSFIALIPKKQDAKFVKDFRPISLIGCFYKIIAKILANRLKMVISDLISEVQSAFIQSCLSSAMGSILVNGSPTSELKFHRGSVSAPWHCIIKELGSLFNKGINLLAQLKKKVGNGVHTLFWKDSWINGTPSLHDFSRLLLEN
ncbi:RNA-directed DNA polymerase, eukaryota [Tanacetum coccineum]